MSAPNHYNVPGANSRQGRFTLVAGIALFGAVYVGFFANMHRRQAKKDELEDRVPGSTSSWPNRMGQAATPIVNGGDNALHATNSARSAPLAPIAREHPPQHRPISADEPRGRWGYIEQPPPQRPHSTKDGLMYTKSPNYVDSFGKVKKVGNGDGKGSAGTGSLTMSDGEQKAV